MEKVFVVGVGMTPFVKPGSREGWDYPDMVADAGTEALADAGITYDQIDQAVVGYNFGDSTAGQRALYELGLTGIPITNVNNNCASGSTALFTARAFIAGGMSDCGLAVGFERMDDAHVYTTRAYPIDKHVTDMVSRRGTGDVVITAQLFGNAGREHMERYGTTAEQFAKVAVKNHEHSVNNPLSQYQEACTLDEVLESRMMWEPLTLLQCCPTSSGAAAAVLASERFVDEHGLQRPGRGDRRPGHGHRHPLRGQRPEDLRHGDDPLGRASRSTSSPASGPRTSTSSSSTTASRPTS